MQLLATNGDKMTMTTTSMMLMMHLLLHRHCGRVDIESTVRLTGKTGVEMEALTAVSVAALTIYDMAKAVDRGMIISNVRVVQKSGGKSGDWNLEE